MPSIPPPPQAKKWCFTRNYTDEENLVDVRQVFIDLDSDYIIFGEEVASTGQKHLQGYVSLKRYVRLTGLKKICSKTHWERARGDDYQNKTYCSKDGSNIYESGAPVLPGSNKRKIMDLFHDNPEEMKLTDPSRYRRCLAEELNKASIVYSSSSAAFPDFDRTWQTELLDMLFIEPDRRTIIWIVGHSGNEGKTTFAQSLHLKEGYFYSRGGKADDVLYQYSIHCGHAVFDLPRDKKDYVQYSVMEAIKDRAWSSNKYEPISIVDIKKFVHVVVMANFMPCVSGYCKDTQQEGHFCKLSDDRVKLIIC